MKLLNSLVDKAINIVLFLVYVVCLTVLVPIMILFDKSEGIKKWM